MCILFLYVAKQTPKSPHGYKLILATNRDEFYSRPARSARFWTSDPTILAGIGLLAFKVGSLAPKMIWICLINHISIKRFIIFKSTLAQKNHINKCLSLNYLSLVWSIITPFGGYFRSRPRIRWHLVRTECPNRKNRCSAKYNGRHNSAKRRH